MIRYTPFRKKQILKYLASLDPQAQLMEMAIHGLSHDELASWEYAIIQFGSAKRG